MAELSKRKYVYALYKASDQTIHVEKYPVVYVNSEYCYFKTARLSTLHVETTRHIHEELTDRLLKDILNGWRAYLWVADEDLVRVMNEANEAKKAKDEQEAIRKIKNEYALAQRRMELAKKAYEALPDEFK